MSNLALSSGLVDAAVIELHADLVTRIGDAVVGTTIGVILFALYYRFVLQRARR